MQASENLGEFLTGDRIENSPYQLFMEQDQFCKILCQVEMKPHEVAALKAIIKEEYHHNWIIDNLPAASIVDSEQCVFRPPLLSSSHLVTSRHVSSHRAARRAEAPSPARFA